MTLGDLLLRIRASLFRRKTESELEEEFATHLEFQMRKYIDAGFDVDEARRRACIDFGSRESAREECREVGGANWVSHVARDLQYTLRAFRRSPGFTCFVIFILALGMGANLATFSVMDAILLRMLPVNEPQSLFRTVNASGNPYDAGGGSSYPLFLQMRRRTSAFADLMAYRAGDLINVKIGHSEPDRLMQQTVSGNYFGVLGVHAAFGRLISDKDDDLPGQHAIAVVSYRFWKNKLNNSPTAIGSKLSFGNRVYDIIGVAPRQFFGVEVGKIVDIWTPISMAPAADLGNDHNFWLRTMGRMKPGVTIAQAAQPMQEMINEFMLEDVRLHAPPGTPKDVIARFLQETRIKGVPAGGGISFLRRQYSQPLTIMMFVVGLVMLIACSNVASILIARGSARRQEITIRLSLGAGRGRIFQQLLTESTLLAILAASAALLVAQRLTPLLIGLLTPSSDPASLVTTMDLRLFGFSSFLMLLTVVLCGFFPAIRLAKADMYTSLRNSRHLTGGGGVRTRKFLLAGQVALTLVLVIGAGLFARTLVNLLSSDTGFKPRSVLIARLTLQKQGDETSSLQAWRSLVQEVRSFPGLEHASLSSAALFAGSPQFQGIRTTATETRPADPVTALSFVSDDYFSTLGIRLIAGRDFQTVDEGPQSAAVAIVNQAFAHKFFGGADPLGRKVTKMANEPVWTEIVGIVDDVKVNSLREAAPPMVYVPYGHITDWLPRQASPGRSMLLQVRGQQDVTSLSAELRRKIPSGFVVDGVFRQQQLVNDTLVRERLLANTASGFGALALTLAGVGLHGVMSYMVVQRRHELGIRMAMGAEPRTIMALVLRESAKVLIPGIILGLIGARLASHWVRALLYGLAPDDPTIFLAASILLLAGLLLAAVIPAIRAANADPMIALRNE